MIQGTCYFVSKRAAKRYYRAYGLDDEAVEAKLKRGEIKVGLPKLRHDESCYINAEEGRWFKQIG